VRGDHGADHPGATVRGGLSAARGRAAGAGRRLARLDDRRVHAVGDLVRDDIDARVHALLAELDTRSSSRAAPA
jgi:hypothetical protein